MAKIITIFFCLRGEPSEQAKAANSSLANTEVAAKLIQRVVGGDLFEIEPLKTYSRDNMELFNETRKELEENLKVEAKAYPADLAQYDTVFVGYPNWWDRLPRVVATFLERYDWTGKRIFPFCTSEGSGLGESVSDIRRICRGAVVDDGAAFSGSQIRGAVPEVVNWAKGRLAK